MIKSFLKNHSIHKKIVPHFDYLFIYNPTSFFTIWVMICVGMYIGHLTFYNYPQWIISFDLKILFLFLSLTLIIGSVFIKNKISSSETTTNNKQKLFVANNKALMLSKISLIIGFIVLFLTNIYNLMLGGLIYIVFTVMFNKNNTIFKRQSLLNLFIVFLIGTLLSLSGYVAVISQGSYFYSLTGSFSYLILIKFFLYGIGYTAIFIIIDIKNSSFEKSLSNVYGMRLMIALSTLMILFNIFIGFYLQEPLITIACVVSIPFFLYALIRKLDKDIKRAIYYPIFIFNFFISTIYPYLFILLIITFYLSKYYNWHRYNFHFPTFLVEND